MFIRQILFGLIGFSLIVHALSAQQATLDARVNTVSEVACVLTNMGTLLGHPLEFGLPDLRCEYPRGSNIEHIGEGGVWVGGITPDNDTLVTSTISWAQPPFWETYPSAEPWDTIWVVERGDTVDIPYWPGYVGVSDQDFIMRYNDYGPVSQTVERHTPLYLDFIQTAYHWGGPRGLDEVIVFTYYIIPTQFNIREAYFTFWLDANIGDPRNFNHFLDDYSFYIPEIRMGASADSPTGPDGFVESEIGVMIFPPEEYDEDELKWSFHWGEDPYAPGMIPPDDVSKYRELMSTGVIMQDQMTHTGAHFTYSVGPFDLTVGDTLRIQAVLVLGMGREELIRNGRTIRHLSEQNFEVPAPPPVPPFVVEPGNRNVRLSWYPTEENNPELYQDLNRADGAEQPFEGYRLYKSAHSINGPWTLLSEWDIPGNEFGYNIGLEYEFLDENLLNNVEYYYSVTAFSKPDTVLNWPSLESSVRSNARTVTPGTPPPATVGQVAVVPNPYRGDIEYHAYNPPWERPPQGRQWIEQDRRIQFINLPPRCEIKIYAVAGRLVQTIHHDDPTRGFADWNLTSSVGQAVGSDIYVFTVRDIETGKTQVGKFVIIK